VVALLTNGKDLSTGEIAKAIGRSVPRTSNILGALRLAERVRYETSTDRRWLTVNFAAVSDPENSYEFPSIVNLIDRSVIADPDSPVVLGAD